MNMDLMEHLLNGLNPFKWKKLINKNQEWTFEGSNFNNNPATPIKWNFRNGYREVFYYRV